MNIECAKEAVKEIFLVEEVSDEQAARLETIIRDLSDREERVFRMHYGLDDGHPRSLLEIAQEFAVSRETIRQVLSKAIKKLRHPTRTNAVLNDPIPYEKKLVEYTLSTEIMDTDLSIRTKNCLKRAGINTVEQLLNTKIVAFYNIKNLGKRSFKEIIDFIGEHKELR